MMKEIPEMFGSLVFGAASAQRNLQSAQPYYRAGTQLGSVSGQCGGQRDEGLGD